MGALALLKGLDLAKMEISSNPFEFCSYNVSLAVHSCFTTALEDYSNSSNAPPTRVIYISVYPLPLSPHTANY